VAVTVTLWAPSAREPVSNELTQAADVAPSTAQVRVEPDSDSVKLTTLSATFVGELGTDGRPEVQAASCRASTSTSSAS